MMSYRMTKHTIMNASFGRRIQICQWISRPFCEATRLKPKKLKRNTYMSTTYDKNIRLDFTALNSNASQLTLLIYHTL